MAVFPHSSAVIAHALWRKSNWLCNCHSDWKNVQWDEMALVDSFLWPSHLAFPFASIHYSPEKDQAIPAGLRNIKTDQLLA